MILSDKTLKKLIEKKELIIDPLDENAFQPASIDCTIGSHYLIMDETQNKTLSLNKPIRYKNIETNLIQIQPKSFILATTQEYIKLPNGISAFVEGRSSIGRMGLFIQNAGWVDTGFEGRITLELFNATNAIIELESGRRICQLVFCEMDQKAEKPYQGKYLKQTQSVGSKIYTETG